MTKSVLIALGCAVWLVGDMRNQLHAIGSQWHGEDMTADWSEHLVVIFAVGKRLKLTEGHRCDARLFTFPSEIADRPELPLSSSSVDAARPVPRGLSRKGQARADKPGPLPCDA